MKKNICFLFCVLLFFSSVIKVIAQSSQHNQQSPPLRGNGLCFTPNLGQYVDMEQQPRPDILFVGDGGGAKIYLRNNAVSYVFSYNERKPDKQSAMPGNSIENAHIETKICRIDMELKSLCRINLVIDIQLITYALQHRQLVRVVINDKRRIKI